MADAISAQLERTTLGPTTAVFSKKKPAGTVGSVGKVQTNLAQIELAPDIVYYKYDVTVTVILAKKDGTWVEKEISKPSHKDTHSQQRKNAAVWVFKQVAKENKSYFEEPTAYDRASMFFSLKQLPEKHFEVPPSEDPELQFFSRVVIFKMAIKPCVENFQVASSSLPKAVHENTSQQDKMIFEVLNLYCSQKPLIETDTFCTFGNTHYLLHPLRYLRDLPKLPDGKYMSVGANKKVSVLEGEEKKATAYVTTEIKKTNFHGDDMDLYYKLGLYYEGQDETGEANYHVMNRNRARLIQYFKNLEVYPYYAPEKIFPIHSFTAYGSEGMLFEDKSGKRKTVLEYFRDVKKITLSFPQLFLVRVLYGTRDEYYPVEVLRVAKNQRVMHSQATSEETQLSIRASAILPKARLQQTQSMKADLGLVPENDNLKKAGITVSRDLAKAPARQLLAPGICYANNRIVETKDNAKWDISRQHYIWAANVGKWGVVGLLTGRDQKLDLNRFAEVIAHQMNQVGMRVPEAPTVDRIPVDVNAIESLMAHCSAENFKFLMFVSSDNTTVHADVKRLESKYQVVTQDTKASTAYKVMCGHGASQTIQNIVHKANMKLGGVNHCVTYHPRMGESWVADNTRMFFGFEFSHPAPLTQSEIARGQMHRTPSVLGFSCNSAANFQSFIGDYRYVAPRSTDPMGKEIANILPERIQQAKNNRGVVPNDLVFYFHGISEGQYAEIATTYKKYIRRGLDILSPQYSPNITLIAVSRDHNERFYLENINGDKAAQQNIPPGIVVDSVVVNPVINEFYLAPHSAFQGTAKAVKYTVIEDSANSMDIIETGTHALCFLHEIVAASVSMPTPLVVADRCAKRGLKVFNSHSGSIPASTTGSFDQDALNQELTNQGKPLEKVRYNA